MIFQYLLAHPNHGYVLAIVTIVYLLNQVDRYLFSSEQPAFVTSRQFDTLSGPLFTVSFTLAGILFSIVAARMNKVYVLAATLLMWSVMTGLTGMSKTFWQVAVARVGQGAFEAGCTPFAAGLIAAYFPPQIKATAMSVYNVGIYAGFSFAQSVATSITSDTGRWQTCYLVFGGIGVAIAALLALTVKDASATPATLEKPSNRLEPATVKEVVLFWLSSPSLILMCVASGVRNAGGYVWAYQVKNWFVKTQHVSSHTYSIYMLWIPLIGGSLGAIFGGFISDKLVNRKRADGSTMGVRGRLIVVILSLIAATPFAAGAILMRPTVPLGFLSLIPSNVIGEMWIGVCMTIVLELTPRNMHTTSIALYQFIITNIGGNAPTLVTPLREYIGGTNAFRDSLLLLFPFTYLLAAGLFVLTFIFVKRDLHRAAEFTAAAQSKRELSDLLLANGNNHDDYVGVCTEEDELDVSADVLRSSGYVSEDNGNRGSENYRKPLLDDSV